MFYFFNNMLPIFLMKIANDNIFVAPSSIPCTASPVFPSHRIFTQPGTRLQEMISVASVRNTARMGKTGFQHKTNESIIHNPIF